jgi:hypothetical protein
MAKGKKKTATTKFPPEDERRKCRNVQKHTLESTLPLAQKIQDEMGGKSMNRLLLAEAMGNSPSSSIFREILSSAYKYGLTDGTEKSDAISLTSVGAAATQQTDLSGRMRALRQATLLPDVFG